MPSYSPVAYGCAVPTTPLNQNSLLVKAFYFGEETTPNVIPKSESSDFDLNRDDTADAKKSGISFFSKVFSFFSNAFLKSSASEDSLDNDSQVLEWPKNEPVSVTIEKANKKVNEPQSEWARTKSIEINNALPTSMITESSVRTSSSIPSMHFSPSSHNAPQMKAIYYADKPSTFKSTPSISQSIAHSEPLSITPLLNEHGKPIKVKLFNHNQKSNSSKNTHALGTFQKKKVASKVDSRRGDSKRNCTPLNFIPNSPTQISTNIKGSLTSSYPHSVKKDSFKTTSSSNLSPNSELPPKNKKRISNKYANVPSKVKTYIQGSTTSASNFSTSSASLGTINLAKKDLSCKYLSPQSESIITPIFSGPRLPSQIMNLRQVSKLQKSDMPNPTLLKVKHLENDELFKSTKSQQAPFSLKYYRALQTALASEYFLFPSNPPTTKMSYHTIT